MSEVLSVNPLGKNKSDIKVLRLFLYVYSKTVTFVVDDSVLYLILTMD